MRRFFLFEHLFRWKKNNFCKIIFQLSGLFTNKNFLSIDVDSVLVDESICFVRESIRFVEIVELSVNYFWKRDFFDESFVNIEENVVFEGESVIFVNESVGLLEIIELSVNYLRIREKFTTESLVFIQEDGLYVDESISFID